MVKEIGGFGLHISWSLTLISCLLVIVRLTEERRLVAEEGTLPKKTWLQKNDG